MKGLSPTFMNKARVMLGLTTIEGVRAFAPLSANANASLVGAASAVVVPSTVTTSDFTNADFLGAHFVINVTAMDAGSTLDVAIQGKDPVSGNYYDLLNVTQITQAAIGAAFPDTTVAKIYPGIATIAGGAASDILPETWRLKFVVGTANATFSVGVNLSK